jgi:hypothetical protein
MNIFIGVFLVLHGLVHLLYSGHAVRFFELQPGLAWPNGSWAFSGLLGMDAARIFASTACLLAAAGFVVAGIALFSAQDWWRLVVITAAVFSAVIFVVFWDGQMQSLSGKGLFAILINLAILVALILFRWPRLGFWEIRSNLKISERHRIVLGNIIHARRVAGIFLTRWTVKVWTILFLCPAIIACALEYNCKVSCQNSLPFASFGFLNITQCPINIPTLVIDGESSFPFIHPTADAIARILPKGQRRTLAAQQHNVSPEVLAASLKEFWQL